MAPLASTWARPRALSKLFSLIRPCETIAPEGKRVKGRRIEVVDEDFSKEKGGYYLYIGQRK